MTKFLIASMFTLALTPLAHAHEGHDQKIMGTVTTVQPHQLEVKGTTGKLSTVVLGEKTKVLMDKMEHKVADIKVGDRVVVIAVDSKGKDGKTILVAKQVVLGTATSSTTKK